MAEKNHKITVLLDQNTIDFYKKYSLENMGRENISAGIRMVASKVAKDEQRKNTNIE